MTCEEYREWFKSLRINEAAPENREAWHKYLDAIGIEGNTPIGQNTIEEWERLTPGLTLLFG